MSVIERFSSFNHLQPYHCLGCKLTVASIQRLRLAIENLQHASPLKADLDFIEIDFQAGKLDDVGLPLDTDLTRRGIDSSAVYFLDAPGMTVGDRQTEIVQVLGPTVSCTA